MCLFSLRLGIICGLVAGILSWPLFGIELPRIPWARIFSILPYANWRYTFAALGMLVISSVYSLVPMRLLIDQRRH